jgi:hypothetical protein
VRVGPLLPFDESLGKNRAARLYDALTSSRLWKRVLPGTRWPVIDEGE